VTRKANIPCYLTGQTLGALTLRTLGRYPTQQLVYPLLELTHRVAIDGAVAPSARRIVRVRTSERA
jgi:hypothetical protein